MTKVVYVKDPNCIVVKPFIIYEGSEPIHYFTDDYIDIKRHGNNYVLNDKYLLERDATLPDLIEFVEYVDPSTKSLLESKSNNNDLIYVKIKYVN